MKIDHIENGNGGYFKAMIDGKEAGLMSYNNAGCDEFIIDHTVVDTNYTGHGVGRSMVMEAVQFARERRMKIIPLCSFARNILAGERATKDVIAHYSLVP